MTLDLAAQPLRLEATLATETIDLCSEEKETEKEAGGKLFSVSPLPLDGLGGLDADIRFSSKQLLANRYTLSDLDATLQLKDGVLSVKPLTLVAGGKPVTGSAVLNGSGRPAFLTLRLAGKQVMTGTLLAGSGEEAPLQQGPTSIDIDLKSRGDSVAALMGSLNGRLLISVGAGRINNRHLDLVGGAPVTRDCLPAGPAAHGSPGYRR